MNRWITSRESKTKSLQSQKRRNRSNDDELYHAVTANAQEPPPTGQRWQEAHWEQILHRRLAIDHNLIHGHLVAQKVEQVFHKAIDHKRLVTLAHCIHVDGNGREEHGEPLFKGRRSKNQIKNPNHPKSSPNWVRKWGPCPIFWPHTFAGTACCSRANVCTPPPVRAEQRPERKHRQSGAR